MVVDLRKFESHQGQKKLLLERSVKIPGNYALLQAFNKSPSVDNHSWIRFYHFDQILFLIIQLEFFAFVVLSK